MNLLLFALSWLTFGLVCTTWAALSGKHRPYTIDMWFIGIFGGWLWIPTLIMAVAGRRERSARANTAR